MKNRVISGCVTVTGPPFAIWRRKIGITEPDEPSTLPKRTATKRVGDIGAVAVGLDDPLAERLRLPHDRLRVRRLVGRDEHEPLRAELDGDVCERSRAERVVADRLDRVGLHHRDVLVRRRMEDDARPVLVEDLAHLDAVLDVGDDRRRRRGSRVRA